MTKFIPNYRIILNLLIAFSVFSFLFLNALSSAYAGGLTAGSYVLESIENNSSSGAPADDVSNFSGSGSLATAPYLSMPVGKASDVVLGFGQFYIDPASGKSVKHSGIDIEALPGTAVLAASSGKVTYIGRTVGTADTAINCLTVTDQSGNMITYRPIDTSLTVGSTVEQGSILGSLREIGDPSSRQPHLNLSVRDPSGKYIDPMTLIIEVPVAPDEKNKPALSEQAEAVKKRVLGIIPNKNEATEPDLISADQGALIKDAMADKASAVSELLTRPQIAAPPIEITAPQARAMTLPQNQIVPQVRGIASLIAARKADIAVTEPRAVSHSIRSTIASMPREPRGLIPSVEGAESQKLYSGNGAGFANSRKTNLLNSSWPSAGHEVRQQKHPANIWHKLSNMTTIILCLMAFSMILFYFSVPIFILKTRQLMRTLGTKQALQLT